MNKSLISQKELAQALGVSLRTVILQTVDQGGIAWMKSLNP